MKPRLFWTILLAFALVIVLGVAGMISFFGLAFAGFWQPDAMGAEFHARQRALAESLADYYIAHGNSWSGVERRLEETSSVGPPGWFGLVLVDADGRVVASNDRMFELGQPVNAELRARGLPVEVQDTRVGTLLLRSPDEPWPGDPGRGRGPPSFFWPVLRGFLLAGLGLTSVLLLMAVFFAQRLSRPIRKITAAAQALAAGKLDVQVEGAPVRELDELTQTFNQMARALAQADQQRRQMTADIAHELRTPLTIIKGRLEGLQDGVYDPTPDQLERLIEATMLLERLVEDLRLLALAEAGQLPLYRETIDPRDLLEDTAATFADQAAAHNVTLHIEASNDLLLVDVDAQRMAQVLANLVTNALRHTPPGGTITLAAENGVDCNQHRSNVPAPRSAVVLRVNDTGAGIAPEDLPHIFDRFWRADRSRARGSGGGGLGLAIAKQIVVAHGGAIWAASTPGHGTTISIALPISGDSVYVSQHVQKHNR